MSGRADRDRITEERGLDESRDTCLGVVVSDEGLDRGLELTLREHVVRGLGESLHLEQELEVAGFLGELLPNPELCLHHGCVVVDVCSHSFVPFPYRSLLPCSWIASS